MSQLPPQLQGTFCGECGAENVAGSPRCWLCYRDLAPPPGVVVAALAPARSRSNYSPQAERVFQVLTLLTVVLVVLVGAGTIVTAAELAVAYWVVVTPALVATGVAMASAASTRGKGSWSRAFTTLAISAALTVGIIVLLIVAAIVALFVMCLSQF